MPWLDDAAFPEYVAGAGLVIFPSDFEGFALPAIEAAGVTSQLRWLRCEAR